MGVEEELKEQLEKAHDSFEKQVAGTMAILAAALAVVTVLGHSSATEEVVNQAKASDQWAYYQAKSIRRYESEIARDILAPQADKAAAYQKSMERYEKEGADIQKEAQGLENESRSEGQKAERYEFGEVFFEVSIVLASVAILTKRKPIWWVSIAGGLVGLVVSVTAYMIK
jgi:hypothetical protein